MAMAQWTTPTGPSQGNGLNTDGSPMIPYKDYFTTPPGQPSGLQYGTNIQLQMPVAQMSSAMQTALQTGDVAGYDAARTQYMNYTNGQLPPWAANITPDMVASNAGHYGSAVANPDANTTAAFAGPTVPSSNGFQYGGAAPATTGSGSNRGGAGAGTNQGLQGGLRTLPNTGIGTPGRTGTGYGLRAGGRSFGAESAGGPMMPPDLSGVTPADPLGGSVGGGGGNGGGGGVGGGGNGGGGTRTTPDGGGTPTGGGTPSGGGTGPTRPPVPPGDTSGPRFIPPGATPGTPGVPPAGPVAPQNPPGGNFADYGQSYRPPAFNPNAPFGPGNAQNGLYYGYQIGAAGNPSLSYIPDLTTNDPNRLFRNVQNIGYNYGAGNSAQIMDQQNQQSGLFNRFGQAADTAYGQLANTPGYTPDEANSIIREQGYQAGVTTPEQYAALAPTASETTGMQGNTASYGDFLHPQNFDTINNQAQGSRNANLATTGWQLRGAENTAGAGLGAALTNTNTGLRAAESGAAAGIGASLANPGLTPTAEYGRQAGMTDQEVTDAENAAARNVGLGTQSTIQDLERRAAAAGTTSPLAMGALRSRLQQQGQVNAADSVVNARLAARQAQRDAATGVQQTQLGAAQYQTGAGIGAAEYQGGLQSQNTLAAGAQAQNAAEYQGSLGSQNAQYEGTAAQNATNQDAANRLGSEQYVTSTGTGIRQAQDTANTQRQAALYALRQGNLQYGQQSTYNQAMGVNNALSANNTNVAQARQAGQAQVRNYLTGQEGQALGAQQTAQGQQLQNYSAMTGALNGNAGQWANYQIGRSSLPAGWQQVVGGLAGAVNSGTQQPTA